MSLLKHLGQAHATCKSLPLLVGGCTELRENGLLLIKVMPTMLPLKQHGRRSGCGSCCGRKAVNPVEEPVVTGAGGRESKRRKDGVTGAEEERWEASLSESAK